MRGLNAERKIRLVPTYSHRQCKGKRGKGDRSGDLREPWEAGILLGCPDEVIRSREVNAPLAPNLNR